MVADCQQIQKPQKRNTIKAFRNQMLSTGLQTLNRQKAKSLQEPRTPFWQTENARNQNPSQNLHKRNPSPLHSLYLEIVVDLGAMNQLVMFNLGGYPLFVPLSVLLHVRLPLKLSHIFTGAVILTGTAKLSLLVLAYRFGTL